MILYLLCVLWWVQYLRDQVALLFNAYVTRSLEIFSRPVGEDCASEGCLGL